MRPFSYEELRFILTKLKERVKDFSEITEETEEFCILRHDVEFSVERAFKVAQLEHEMGIKASFFFQLNNNCYNIISDVSRNMVRQIAAMGHRIGFHVHQGSCDPNNASEIKRKVAFMSQEIGVPIDRFSVHRPGRNKDVLKNPVQVPGLINAYSPLFFHYFEGDKPELRVVYMSDSNHRWLYGVPSMIWEQNIVRSQILMHPYSWTEEGHSNEENYRTMLVEKDRDLRKSINNEIKTFPEELLNETL